MNLKRVSLQYTIFGYLFLNFKGTFVFHLCLSLFPLSSCFLLFLYISNHEFFQFLFQIPQSLTLFVCFAASHFSLSGLDPELWALKLKSLFCRLLLETWKLKKLVSWYAKSYQLNPERLYQSWFGCVERTGPNPTKVKFQKIVGFRNRKFYLLL